MRQIWRLICIYLCIYSIIQAEWVGVIPLYLHHGGLLYIYCQCFTMSMVTFSHQTYNETQYWNVEVLNSEVCVFLQKSLFMLHIYLRYLTPSITRGLVWTSWNYTKNKQPLHDKQIKRAWVHRTEERGVESSARSPARSFRSGSRIKQREGEPHVFGCRSSGSSGKTENKLGSETIWKASWMRQSIWGWCVSICS